MNEMTTHSDSKHISEQRRVEVTPDLFSPSALRGDPFLNPTYLAEQRFFRLLDAYLKTSFFVFVVIPSLLIGLYYGLIASNQYTSEVRAVIRAVDLTNLGSGGNSSFGSKSSSPSADASTSSSSSGGGGRITTLSNALSGSQSVFGRSNTIQTAPKEAYLIQEYVKSKSIIDDLNRLFPVDAIFRGHADFWARLPNDASPEELLSYWKSHIEASVEGPAGVLIIRFRTFNAEQSAIILKKIIAASEAMVNQLQRQVLQDTFDGAKQEYDKALTAYRRVQEELTAYRSESSIINPLVTFQTSSQLLLIALSERIKIVSDIRFMKETMSHHAPSVRALEEKLKSLNEQISQIQAELTGFVPDQKNLANFIVKYEEIELRRSLAERTLTNASSQVENSRLRLDQQRIYVEPFVGPTQIASSDYPKRAMMTIIIAVFLLMAWSIHGLVLLAIRDQLI